MASLQDLLDVSYSIINEPQTSTTYPTSLLTTFINEAQLKICGGTVVNFQTKQTVQKGQALYFLTENQPYQGADDLTIQADVNIGDTNLQVSDTTYYPTTGQVYIMGSIVSYTGKTSNTLTGIPTTGQYALRYPYQAGTYAKIAYACPDDYNQLVRFIHNDSIALTNKDFRLNWMNANDPRWAQYTMNPFTTGNNLALQPTDTQIRPAYYSIINGDFIVAFNCGANLDHFLLMYEKVPPTLVNISDDATIPDPFAKTTIPFLAVALMFSFRGEEDRAMTLMNNFGHAQIQSFYDWADNLSDEGVFNQAITS